MATTGPSYRVKGTGRVVGDPQRAWEMRQELDGQGNPRYSWNQIADACGYNSGTAASIMARRYGQRASTTEDTWASKLPWPIDVHQRREYIYKTLMWYVKRRAGVTLPNEENDRLDLFLATLKELGTVLAYDPVLKFFYQRPRLPSDDPDLPFVEK